MKVGDLVLNHHPESGFFEQLGVVIRVVKDTDGYTLIKVQCNNCVALWFPRDCEVINGSR